MQELLEIMRRLRAPDGCPWDKEQTHESLKPYLLEEAAEAVDAIDQPNRLELADELGDVLLQIAFHSVIAEAEGTFNYTDVERSIVDKMIRRHPHVFADTKVADSQEVVTNWNTIKLAERGGKPKQASQQIPAALGALARETEAQKLADRADNNIVTDSSTERANGRAKLQDAMQTAPDSEEGVAQVLAAVVAWARSLKVSPEFALRAHTAKSLECLDHKQPDQQPDQQGL